ncbi:anti-sigma factor [Novosphingobium sp.]|uniref:anti-sigma factor n=1 Tax=Novosphingobium sp. TaxID=1874826 RepID=UPI003B51919B
MTGLEDLPDDDLLAAELALGLLDADDAELARGRLRQDGAFAHAYARWSAWAAGLAADLGEAPPAHIWPAIIARLPANDDQRGHARLRRWQGGAIAASLAALVLGVALWQRPVPPPPIVSIVQAPAAPMVAVLTGKSGVVSVNYDPSSGRIASVINGLDTRDGNGDARAPELWVIPADGKPRSLGVMPQDRIAWHAPAATSVQMMKPGVTLAVSLEPQGGSKTGLPTGPVVLTGKLAQVS